MVGKRLPYTPNSQIKSALRRLWLRSRERASAIKRDKYTCQRCHRKQSVAKGKEFKVEVHHNINSVDINWEELYKVVRKYLLVDPKKLTTLCKECHDEEHKKI